MKRMSGTAGVGRSCDGEERAPPPRESLPAEPDQGTSPEISRRKAMSLVGAALALGGATSCRRPEERILPYARAPEEVVPGRPLHFATAASLYGTAFGLLVESHEGRPTKVEGNPLHPESLGATTSHLQAMILDLYDPDRSPGPRERGTPRSWSAAAAMLKSLGQELRANEGGTLAVVTEAHRSPTLRAALTALRTALPRATVVRYEMFDRSEAHAGAAIAFGKKLESICDFAKARVVLALDADPLGTEGSPLKNARSWALARGADVTGANRLYAVESSFSITGANAEHRLRCASGQVPAVLAAIIRAAADENRWELGPELSLAVASVAEHAPKDERSKRDIRAIARDLSNHLGSSLVVVGHRQPRAVHALAHWFNHALGNIDKTVNLVAVFDDGPEGVDALGEVVRGVEGGTLQSLILLGTNPVFDAPADLMFHRAIERVARSIHLSAYFDETSSVAAWHLNRAHPFESWSDLVSEAGAASVVQPLVAPLFGGKTETQVVRMLLGDDRAAFEHVRETWKQRLETLDFETRWHRILREGIDLGSAHATEPLPVRVAAIADAVGHIRPPSNGVEVVFVPDSHAHDGRFANNAWLQELPDPFSKLTWGTAARVSTALATRLGVTDGDHVTLTVSGTSVLVPVVVAPGQADATVTVMVGQGRRFAGRVARGVGVDTYPLTRTTAFGWADDVVVQPASGHSVLARTQTHFAMEGRSLARQTKADPGASAPVATTAAQHALELWKPPAAYEQGHKWGMCIDLARCIGCGACVVACQAENNIPVVGHERIAQLRGMHWVRVDRYYEGPIEEPSTIAQPIPCQQCENAPCEPVCPVGATAHSPEGLNDMAYQRCIGTRYCAANCPYKVRRFNYFEYAKGLPEVRKLQFNPDVTIRSRGVMEKCTFCVQRIQQAKIAAKVQGTTAIEDGRIVTACEQACPTQAIVFGDLNNEASRVAKTANDPRAYRLLEELNTRPRITYLARIDHPNPEFETRRR